MMHNSCKEESAATYSSAGKYQGHQQRWLPQKVNYQSRDQNLTTSASDQEVTAFSSRPGITWEFQELRFPSLFFLVASHSGQWVCGGVERIREINSMVRQGLLLPVYCILHYQCLAEMLVSQEPLKLFAHCLYCKMTDCSYSQAELIYLSAKAIFMENGLLDSNCKKYLLYRKTTDNQ